MRGLGRAVAEPLVCEVRAEGSSGSAPVRARYRSCGALPAGERHTGLSLRAAPALRPRRLRCGSPHRAGMRELCF